MPQALSFQEIFMTLLDFWQEWGCLIWQPYHTEVGAGTMNPGTFLRVLGPEPWHVAYVEPSIRPDDARYGENPNRMQQHYQIQVILKPDPGNPQELYLESLEALGFDLSLHDVRFVEDNWQQPALGAWGLGWQVWMDGQEISQFTYFQQAGGVPLDPVSVELTYGLERIAMALQRVHDFRLIRWTDGLTYGDVNLQAEQEHSRYYFEVADVARLQKLFALYEAEAESALAQDLVLPAYDYVLKCSHSFNVLDTRGAIGVTERQALFGRMRELARRVADAYLAQRQGLEYPWLVAEDGAMVEEPAAPAAETDRADWPDQAAPFLLEIGTEELPPSDVEAALVQLREAVPALLEDLRLAYAEVEVLGTPRRLVVHVRDLAPRQDDLEQVVKGPPADRAFDDAGAPTQAARGFARSRGVPVEALEVREVDGGAYAVATVQERGRPTLEVLSEALPDLIAGLQFEKSMRWNYTNIAFSRPIRWLLAMFGDRAVSFEYAGLQAGTVTRNLRTREPETIPVADVETYFQALEAEGIVVDPAIRMRRIQRGMNALAEEVGGTVPPDPQLLHDVTHEVEVPTVLRGAFDEGFLDLPRDVLIAVMKKHQNYFPVEREGRLLPHFLTVRNGDDRGLDGVRQGNEDVIQARFADAAFFIQEDEKQPLEAHRPKLETLAFQEDLGSMLDKTRRIEALVGDLAARTELEGEALETARRAAALSKADLVTRMVIEMTSLQGIMGAHYALRSGEPEAVATAIFEHYLPRFAGDAVPETRPGLVVGLADRLDTLAGLFAVGLAPTGAKDPFAQRRAALGMVGNLIAWELDFDVRAGLDAAAARLPVQASHESLEDSLAFVVERLRNLLLEEGFRYDVVDAVLAAQGENPARAARAVRALSEWVAHRDWDTVLPAYSRCVRITREASGTEQVDPERLQEPAERALYEAVLEAERADRAPGSVDDFLNAFLPLIPAIDRFFDEVLVMVEEPALRESRLGMLRRIAALSAGVADLSRLEGF